MHDIEAELKTPLIFSFYGNLSLTRFVQNYMDVTEWNWKKASVDSPIRYEFQFIRSDIQWAFVLGVFLRDSEKHFNYLSFTIVQTTSLCQVCFLVRFADGYAFRLLTLLLFDESFIVLSVFFDLYVSLVSVVVVLPHYSSSCCYWRPWLWVVNATFNRKYFFRLLSNVEGWCISDANRLWSRVYWKQLAYRSMFLIWMNCCSSFH